MMNRLKPLIVAGLLLGVSGTSIADEASTTAMENAVEAGFSELEKQIIGEYYSDANTPPVTGEEENAGTAQDRKPKGKPAKGKNKSGDQGQLPKGLAKRDRLPPGLERQLQKNGTLPPGLAKRSLPRDLEQRLPPVPEGYERQIIEDSTVVLVELATGRIADVLTDIILGRE